MTSVFPHAEHWFWHLQKMPQKKDATTEPEPVQVTICHVWLGSESAERKLQQWRIDLRT